MTTRLVLAHSVISPKLENQLKIMKIKSLLVICGMTGVSTLGTLGVATSVMAASFSGYFNWTDPGGDSVKATFNLENPNPQTGNFHGNVSNAPNALSNPDSFNIQRWAKAFAIGIDLSGEIISESKEVIIWYELDSKGNLASGIKANLSFINGVFAEGDVIKNGITIANITDATYSIPESAYSVPESTPTTGILILAGLSTALTLKNRMKA